MNVILLCLFTPDLYILSLRLLMIVPYRAVARSENPGGLVVLGGENLPPLVEIGLTDLPKTGGV